MAKAGPAWVAENRSYSKLVERVMTQYRRFGQP